MPVEVPINSFCRCHVVFYATVVVSTGVTSAGIETLAATHVDCRHTRACPRLFKISSASISFFSTSDLVDLGTSLCSVSSKYLLGETWRVRSLGSAQHVRARPPTQHWACGGSSHIPQRFDELELKPKLARVAIGQQHAKLQHGTPPRCAVSAGPGTTAPRRAVP